MVVAMEATQKPTTSKLILHSVQMQLWSRQLAWKISLENMKIQVSYNTRSQLIKTFTRGWPSSSVSYTPSLQQTDT